MKQAFLFVILITTFFVSAQEFKVGKIDASWFEKALSEEQQEAPAIFLEKYRSTNFEYRDNLDGWTLFTTVHNVIKIINTEGLDYGTKKIRLVHRGREEEKLDRIEAYSYSLQNGKVDRRKMDKSTIIENKLTKQLDETILIIPNVKVGDIVEYSYRLESTYWHIDDLIVQEDIPVQHMYAKIAIPQFFDYKVYITGSIEVDAKQTVESRTENFSTEEKNPFGGRTQFTNLSNIKFEENVKEFEFENIPRIKEEPLVNNINNFRSAVVWELAAIEMSKGNRVNRAETWDQVSSYFYEQLEIGDDLNSLNILKDIAEQIKSRSNSKEVLIDRAYAHIKNSLNWDGEEFSYKKPNLKRAYNDGVGSAYEINMLLVALLQEIGIESAPVMASTKKNGVPLFPTVGGFNYVLAGVQNNNEWIVLDATEKNAVQGLLPERVMNWEGRLVSPDVNSKGISLFADSFSVTKAMIIATINTTGEVTGKARRLYSNNAGLRFVNTYKKTAQSTREKLLQKEFDMENISDVTFKIQSLEKPVSVSFSFIKEDEVEMISDKMYVAPQLFLSRKSNPFNQSKREYPIDLSYPKSVENVLTLNIPVDYTIESIPDALEISLPVNLGTYRFACKKTTASSVQIMSSLSINTTLISPDNYDALKDFYAQIVAKEKEMIVLNKN